MNLSEQIYDQALTHESEPSMHDAIVIAQKFLKLARDHNQSLTAMQLLKLVYLAHGWMLGLFDTPLIKNRIEAWKYGPVIPDLYQAIKHFKDQPITDLDEKESAEALNPMEDYLIQVVYDTYSRYSGMGLSSLTHQPGTPWHQVYRNDANYIPIPNTIIKQHYQCIFNS